MTGSLYILCLFLGLSFAVSGEVVFGPNTWAVLIAGSGGWMNYGQQANICHSYHSLLKKGVPKDKIITFMYDDIANNPENPTKGTIINRPGGKDVYNGVVIDYKERDITPANFLNVLEGKEELMKSVGSGRVLKSSENETVFVFFSDHGSTGILCFPYEYLMAPDLISTLNRMSENKMFGKLILYIDACESGSMFDGYIDHLKNVFANTAAARDEPGLMYYCDSAKYGTCLSTAFGARWMERLDNLQKSEKLFDSFNAVRTAVRESHVQMYGDYNVGFVEEFNSDEVEYHHTTEDSLPYEESESVDIRDAPLYFARKDLEAADDHESRIIKKEKLEQMIQGRKYADRLITKILEVYTGGDIDLQNNLESAKSKLELDMFPCYKGLVDAFDNNCFRINKSTYFLKHLYKLANICVKDINSADKAVSAINAVCNDENETINNLIIDIV